MVLGIIPGPTEPKGNINTFLSPIIEDLLLLWNGVYNILYQIWWSESIVES